MLPWLKSSRARQTPLPRRLRTVHRRLFHLLLPFFLLLVLPPCPFAQEQEHAHGAAAEAPGGPPPAIKDLSAIRTTHGLKMAVALPIDGEVSLKVDGTLDEPVWQEARVNLTENDQHRRLNRLLRKVRIVTAVAPLPPNVQLPEKDQPILQAALEAQATHLLTGDKEHCGPYFGRRLSGVLVLPPADYFERRG